MRTDSKMYLSADADSNPVRKILGWVLTAVVEFGAQDWRVSLELNQPKSAFKKKLKEKVEKKLTKQNQSSIISFASHNWLENCIDVLASGKEEKYSSGWRGAPAKGIDG